MMRLPRGSVVATALAVAIFQVAGTFGASSDQPERRAVDAVAITLVLVGPLALLATGRWPVAAAIAAVVSTLVYVYVGYAYGPIFLSVALTLFLAIQAGRRRPAWIVAAVGFAAFVIATRYGEVQEKRPGLLHLALVAGWLALVLAVAEVVRTRRLRAAELTRLAEDEKQRQEDASRLDLARELHDVLAHNISLINVQASVALHLIDDRPDQVAPALTAIKSASRDALHELRTALDLLRRGDDAPRAPAPQLAELPALVDAVRASGLALHDELPEVPATLPAHVQLAAYRIVQEALTNVSRHSRAESASVRIRYDDGVAIEIVDDGVGGGAPDGNGINGMRERATAMGGTLDAGPAPAGGWRVAAHLPMGQP